MSKTYAERINEVREDEQKKNAFKKKTMHTKMTDDEQRYASAMIALKDNANFKIFMEFEAKIIGERMGEAFRLPPAEVLDTNDYGCRMAFNHGRYYQMRYFMNTRNLLQKMYLDQLKLEQEEKNGED